MEFPYYLVILNSARRIYYDMMQMESNVINVIFSFV